MRRRILGALLASVVVLLPIVWRTVLHGWPPRAILRGAPPDLLALLAPLDRPVTAHFDAAPLDKVLAHLEFAANLALPLDSQALAKGGISPTSPITLHLDEAPLEWALDELQRQAQVYLGVRDGALIVTAAGEGLVPLLHPTETVRALHGVTEAGLENLLQAIHPESWGYGSLQSMPGGVMVWQTVRQQREIAQLLATLARPPSGTRPVRIDGLPWHDERFSRRVRWNSELGLNKQLESLCQQAGLRVSVGQGAMLDKRSSKFDESFHTSLSSALEIWEDESSFDSWPSWSIRDDTLRVGEGQIVGVHPLTGISHELDAKWYAMVEDSIRLGLAQFDLETTSLLQFGHVLVVWGRTSVQWQVEAILARVRRAQGRPTHLPPRLVEEDRIETALEKVYLPTTHSAIGSTLGDVADHLTEVLQVSCLTSDAASPVPPAGVLWSGASPSWLEQLATHGLSLELGRGGIVWVVAANSKSHNLVQRVYRLPSLAAVRPFGAESAPEIDWKALIPTEGLPHEYEFLLQLLRDDEGDYAVGTGAGPAILTARVGLIQQFRMQRLIESWRQVQSGEHTGPFPGDPQHLEGWARSRAALREPLEQTVVAESLAALLDKVSATTGIRFALDANADVARTRLTLAADGVPLGAALARELLSIDRTFDVHTSMVRVRRVDDWPTSGGLRLYAMGDLLDIWAAELGWDREQRDQAALDLPGFLALAAGEEFSRHNGVLNLAGDVLMARCWNTNHERIEQLLDRLRRTGAPEWGEPAWRDRGWSEEFDTALDRPLSIVATADDEAGTLRRIAEAAGLERYLVIDGTKLVYAAGGDPFGGSSEVVAEPLTTPRAPTADAGRRILFVRCPAHEVLHRTARLFARTSFVHRGVLTLHEAEDMPDHRVVLYDDRLGQSVFEAHLKELSRQSQGWRKTVDPWEEREHLALEWYGLVPGPFLAPLPRAITCGPWLAASESAEDVPQLAILDELTSVWSAKPIPSRTPDEWRAHVTWEGTDVLLADAIRELANQTGIALCSTPDAAALWENRVTVHMDGKQLNEVLPELLAEHGLCCEWERALLVVRPMRKQGTVWTRISLRPLWDEKPHGDLTQIERLLESALLRQYWRAGEVGAVCRVLDQFLVYGSPALIHELQGQSIDPSWGTSPWALEGLASDNRFLQRAALIWLAGPSSPNVSGNAATVPLDLAQQHALIAFMERLAQAPPNHCDEPVLPLVLQLAPSVPGAHVPLEKLLQREDLAPMSRQSLVNSLVCMGDAGVAVVLRHLRTLQVAGVPSESLVAALNMAEDEVAGLTPAIVPDLLRTADGLQDDDNLRLWLRRLARVVDPDGVAQRSILKRWSQGTPEESARAARLQVAP